MKNKEKYISLIVSLLCLVSIALHGCQSSKTKTITIQSTYNMNKDMIYDTPSFTVNPKQVISLTFKNSDPNPTMRHNIIILKPSTNIVEFSTKAIAYSSDFIPKDKAIIAYTPLLSSGDSITIRFTAPEKKGEYPYLCTFPGHFTTMNGMMIVK
ncbi:hypothetical protein DID78_00380 [Candidatus Marinamargulisbacteria bacterium SCGC AG-343-D04]|nr:hypothetical protein DID78_00380 [Candidatus Marinamargulisbacteria bacterium SCGC AG-343-D04]